MNKIIRLKSLISSILVVALLNLCGCYSFSALTEEEMANYHPTKIYDTKFILKDGSEIIYEYKPSSKDYLIRIDEPSDLIYGRGRLLYKGHPVAMTFYDEIPREKIDSTSSTYIDKELHQQFWLKDGNCVTFKEGDYVDIIPDDGIGYWVSGMKDDQPFIGKIDFDEIDEIQVDENKWTSDSDILQTGLIVLGVVSAVIFVVGIVVWISNPPFSPK